MENSTRKKNTMIIGGMVVLTILAFLLINFFSGPNTPVGENNGPTKEDLIYEIEELESSILELEVVFEGMKNTEDINTELLEQKRDEINTYTQKIADLEQKIAQMEQSKSADRSTINRLKEQLAELKKKKQAIEDEFTKQEVEYLYMDNKKLLAMKDSLEDALAKPDSVLQRKEDEIAQLKADLMDCGSSPTLTAARGETLDGMTFEEVANKLFKEKENLAQFQLYNDGRFGDPKPIDNKVDASRLKTLQVEYIVTNENIEKFLNGKTMFLRIIDLMNEELTSGTEPGYLIKGTNMIAASQGKFQTGNGIKFDIEPPGGKWGAGGYRLEIYTDGQLVGRKVLAVN
jgi:predicted  nucleic acid-binding Zn-ribbon protein